MRGLVTQSRQGSLWARMPHPLSEPWLTRSPARIWNLIRERLRVTPLSFEASRSWNGFRAGRLLQMGEALGPDELAMILEAATNLPEEVIDKLTRNAATETGTRSVERSPPRWLE